MSCLPMDLAKFLALVLRHKPGVIGLELDPEGWVEVETLLAGSRKKGINLDREALNRVVETDEKGRYQFSPEGEKFGLARATPFRLIWA